MKTWIGPRHDAPIQGGKLLGRGRVDEEDENVAGYLMVVGTRKVVFTESNRAPIEKRAKVLDSPASVC